MLVLLFISLIGLAISVSAVHVGITRYAELGCSNIERMGPKWDNLQANNRCKTFSNEHAEPFRSFRIPYNRDYKDTDDLFKKRCTITIFDQYKCEGNNWSPGNMKHYVSLGNDLSPCVDLPDPLTGRSVVTYCHELEEDNDFHPELATDYPLQDWPIEDTGLYGDIFGPYKGTDEGGRWRKERARRRNAARNETVV